MHVTSNGGLSLPKPSIAGQNVAKRFRPGSFAPSANATEARLRPARKINPGIAFRMED
jgi:hypothetical protein